MNRYFFLFFLLPILSYSQRITLSGNIKNSNNQSALSNVSVVIMNKDNLILGYNYSDNKGYYKITFQRPKDGNVLLKVSSLGFKKIKEEFVIEQDSITKNFDLVEQVETLNEVTIKSYKQLYEKKDTTTVIVKYFQKNETQNLESVLKDIPGIEVRPNGEILAHGKSIDKILIDGENLVGKNYKLLTKNLNAITVEKIQIIENFEDNPILKSVLDSSEKVALNLKIDSNLKNIWFGNVQLGYGFLEDVWQENFTLGLFKKRIKLLAFNTYNSVGVKASDNLGVFYNNYDDNSFEKYVEDVSFFFRIDNNSLYYFDDTQSLFNKGRLHNINVSNKLSDKLTVRSAFKYTKDRQSQQSNLKTMFNYDTLIIDWSEQTDYRDNNTFFSYELETMYNPNDTHFIKNIFTIDSKPSSIINNILLNDNSVSQELNNNDRSFKNHLFYTLKISKKSVLNNYLFFGNTNLEQQVILNNQIVNQYLEDNTNQALNIFNENSIYFFGLKNKIILSKSKIKQIITLKNVWQKESFKSQTKIGLTNYQNLFNNKNFERFNNTLDYQFQYFFNKKLKIITDLELERFYYTNLDKTFFFFSPKLRFELKNSSFGTFVLSYNASNDLPNIYNGLSNYSLNSYNSFYKGTSELRSSKTRNLKLVWRLYNDKKRVSLSSNINYMFFLNKNSSQTFVHDNFFLSVLYNTEHSRYLSYNIRMVNYFRKLKTVSKFEIQKTDNLTPYKINEEQEIKEPLRLTNINLTTTTKFNKKIILETELYAEIMDNNLLKNPIIKKSFKTMLNYNPSKNWSFELNANYYIIEKDKYQFFNTNVYFRPKDSRFSFNLLLNNISNERLFNQFTFSDYKTTNLQVKLVPFYFLGSAKYRF